MTGSELELRSIAKKIRRKIISISHDAKTPHIGSALSCVEILVAAYWRFLKINPNNPDDPCRDRLVFSKGHAATALYCALCLRNFFTEDFLSTYATEGGMLPEHPSPGCAPGVEVASGSLGHGLSIGVGMALASRIQRFSYRVYVLMSDGECNEGSVWEAAMLAPAKNIQNLAVVVDFNRWQATGRSEEVMALAPLVDKWKAFGWSAHAVDGHDIDELAAVLQNVPDGSGRPVAVIANTIKGKGVSFMEDDNNWHYRIPSEDELKKALTELDLP